MDSASAAVGLEELGVLEGPELRAAIAAFLAPPAGRRVLTISARGACSMIGRLAEEAQVVTAPQALPFTDGSFDRCVCVDFMRQLDDPEAFLIEVHRVLGAGGGVVSIAAEPNARTTRGYLVKAGFAWSESYEVMMVERVTEASDVVETRIFATSGWIGQPSRHADPV